MKIHNEQDVSAPTFGTTMAIAPESTASARKPLGVCVQNLSLSICASSCLERSKSRSRSSQGRILNNLSFAFEAGGLHAIMGSSGSGKSTLLNAIAGRSNKTLQTGHVLVNGQIITPRQLRSTISVVPQDEICSLPFLTVRETLHAAALLRLSPELTRSQKLARADEILHSLALQACADTIIGGSRARGISGGERRRVSIALQVLTNSPVLLLDEPTSGLDGATAAEILQCLASLAQAGRTVIMVIHQPRWKFLKLFKSILMLSQNGRQAFSGSANDLLARLSDGKELPPFINPADLALDILAENQELPAGKIDEQDNEFKDFMCSRQTSCASISDTVSLTAAHRTIKFCNALPVLLWRTMLNYRRSPSIVVERVMQITGLGILLSVFFTPIGTDYWSIQSRLGLFCQASALYFVGMLDAVAIYPAERRLFRQELSDGASSSEVFLAQYTIVGVIIQVTGSLLYSALLLITGLPRTAEFFFATAYTTLAVVSCGESIGLIFLSFINHDGLAIAIMAALLCLSMALCGTLSISLPSWINALNHINPAKWQVQISASISMRDEAFGCAAEATGMESCTTLPGQDVLDLYGLNRPLATSCGILLGLVIGYRIVAYMVVKWRIRQ
ncbi:putative ABC transporter ATP-binding protein/permease [Pseudocercospora fuligena]|uniref:Putative ABC transporter ATP-binding protein/permease n=1 Tax=Pseudocercospora fuligena TaxID=685502 RepID=A0A8H6RKF8_9PEZI|nr:putative ABC transporter ATP-binding protein/permease [Pseudocercospora fuligena]